MRKILSLMLVILMIAGLCACTVNVNILPSTPEATKPAMDGDTEPEQIMKKHLQDKYGLQDVVLKDVTVVARMRSDVIQLSSSYTDFYADKVALVSAKFSIDGVTYEVYADLSYEPICYDNYEHEKIKTAFKEYLEKEMGGTINYCDFEAYDKIDIMQGDHKNLLNRKFKSVENFLEELETNPKTCVTISAIFEMANSVKPDAQLEAKLDRTLSVTFYNARIGTSSYVYNAIYSNGISPLLPLYLTEIYKGGKMALDYNQERYVRHEYAEDEYLTATSIASGEEKVDLTVSGISVETFEKTTRRDAVTNIYPINEDAVYYISGNKVGFEDYVTFSLVFFNVKDGEIVGWHRGTMITSNHIHKLGKSTILYINPSDMLQEYQYWTLVKESFVINT